VKLAVSNKIKVAKIFSVVKSMVSKFDQKQLYEDKTEKNYTTLVPMDHSMSMSMETPSSGTGCRLHGFRVSMFTKSFTDRHLINYHRSIIYFIM